MQYMNQIGMVNTQRCIWVALKSDGTTGQTTGQFMPSTVQPAVHLVRRAIGFAAAVLWPVVL